MLEGIKYREFMRFLTLAAGLGFQGIITGCIPFLFYRPTLECYEKGPMQQNYTYFSCNEFDACNIIHKYQDENKIFENNPLYSQYEYTDSQSLISYLIKFVVPYEGITSLSIEYNLFCDRKIIEANILAISLGCQILGSFLALVIKIPPYTAQILFITMIMLSSFYTFCFNFVVNLYVLAGIYCLWNIMYQYYMSIIYSQINQIFSQKIQDFGPSITNVLWVTIVIIYVIGAYFIRDYRTNLGIFACGMSVIIAITSVYFYDKKLDQELKEKHLQKQQEADQDEDNKSYILNLFKHFVLDYKIISKHKLMKYNSLTWTLCMCTICICYMICLVLLNTLLGNLYVNTLGHNVLELIGNSFSGYLIYRKVDIKGSIKNMFILVGFAYSLSLLTSLITSSDGLEVSNFVIFQRLFPILIGKAIHELAWTFLYTYINDLIEKDQQQFATAFGQFSSLVFCAIVPYYKYIMEYFQLNSFIILPIICFYTAYCVQKYMHPIDTSNKRILLQDDEQSQLSKPDSLPIELQEMELR